MTASTRRLIPLLLLTAAAGGGLGLCPWRTPHPSYARPDGRDR
jgi:hypothetical protein